MKHLVLAVVALLSFACGSVALARWGFIPPASMVQRANLIAIVNIGVVQDVDTRAGSVIYDRRATANIEKFIKGSKLTSLTLVAGVKGPNGNKLCLPDYDLKSGRHLVFLLPSGSNYVTVNADLGFLAIVNDRVEWFSNVNVPGGERIQRPLKSVIADIEELMQAK